MCSAVTYMQFSCPSPKETTNSGCFLFSLDITVIVSSTIYIYKIYRFISIERSLLGLTDRYILLDTKFSDTVILDKFSFFFNAHKLSLYLKAKIPCCVKDTSTMSQMVPFLLLLYIGHWL